MFCMCENLPQAFASVLLLFWFSSLLSVTYIYSAAANRHPAR